MDKRIVKKAIGKRIKQYREKSGLTQEELAEKVGLSTNYLSAVERGISFPRIEKLISIINAIDATADQIFIDVLKKSYKTRSSILTEKIELLSLEEQQHIFAVVDAMIDNFNEKYKL